MFILILKFTLFFIFIISYLDSRSFNTSWAILLFTTRLFIEILEVFIIVILLFLLKQSEFLIVQLFIILLFFFKFIFIYLKFLSLNFFLFDGVLEYFLIEVVNLLRIECSALKSLHELLLNSSLKLSSLLSCLFSIGLSLLILFVDSNHLFLSVHTRQLELTLSNNHLM